MLYGAVKIGHLKFIKRIQVKEERNSIFPFVVGIISYPSIFEAFYVRYAIIQF